MTRSGAMMQMKVNDIIEEYYKRAVYPKQSLLASETDTLRKLKMAVGIMSERGFSQLPMTDEQADKVY